MESGERRDPVEDQYSNPFDSRSEFLAERQKQMHARGFAAARETLDRINPSKQDTSVTDSSSETDDASDQ